MKSIRLKPGRAKLALNRNPWIYSGALQNIIGSVTQGMAVSVEDNTGAFVAYGYYNPANTIAVRLLEWNEKKAPDEMWWKHKVEEAVKYRQQYILNEETDSCRLIFSESDGLPGVIADKFADVIVVQFNTAGAQVNKKPVVEALIDAFKPKAVYEHVEGELGRIEKYDCKPGFLFGTHDGNIEIKENGITYNTNFLDGQKTGFYFDQRVNRQRAAAYAKGKKCLDCFSYTGGFTLNMLRGGAKSVTAVDSSYPALEILDANCQKHGYENYEAIHGDVFEYLREMDATGQKFDLIVLDPPKLSPGKAGQEKAMRAYKDLNMIGLKCLRPGGILLTFSCSGSISRDDLKTTVSWAAKDTGKSIRIIESMFQAPCHPSTPALPESEYLKGFIIG